MSKKAKPKTTKIVSKIHSMYAGQRVDLHQEIEMEAELAKVWIENGWAKEVVVPMSKKAK